MRNYVTSIRSYVDGSSEQINLKRKVEQFPIFIAGLTEKTAELAGEVADGLMPYLASTAHLQKLINSAKIGRENHLLIQISV